MDLPPTNLRRLNNDGYIRPKKTYTDTLQTNKAIEQKLDQFVEIDEKDIDSIPKNSFIRYIKLDPKTGDEKFVTGGLLLRITPQYLLLMGKNNGTFCAQRYTYKGDKVIYKTRFFKLLSKEERLQEELVDTQENANNLIKKYEEALKQQQEEIEGLKKIIKKMKKKET